MKRTVPLLITALAGAILIASRFIPAAESWGEVAAIWFDVLAAVAFVLGGGSLLKLQLKKISDRTAGWGYAVITLAAFLITLFCGLSKIGAPPAPQQESYGQTYVPLAVGDLPESTVVSVPGSIPARADGMAPPLSVKRQLRQESRELVFRGWMTSRQRDELSAFLDTRSWKCAIQRLYEASQPKPPLKGKMEFRADHSVLSVRGFMTDDVREALRKLKGNERWNAAVETLFERSHRESRVSAPQLPNGFTIPPSMKDDLFYDDQQHELGIRGPMSTAVRDTLARASFPFVRPLSADARNQFRRELESRGSSLNRAQLATLDNVLKKTWVVEKLRVALDEAGKAVEIQASPCDQPTPEAEPKQSGPDHPLNLRQRTELDHFATQSAMTIDSLVKALQAAGPFNDRQEGALREFFDKVPTIAEQKLDLCVKLLSDGPLSTGQRNFLVDDYRVQNRWRQIVGQLFVAAHVTKYPWSGQYTAQESGFGWLYEFVFKPLQATMFALLAFYVASAAFRAFRAKNFEAILLLGTAFIVLLGQTFAGYWLTAWIPADSPFAVLKIENLTEWVAVFLTAGSRAIMIGIALGIASTSLKVLLGIDRSYLGTGED